MSNKFEVIDSQSTRQIFTEFKSSNDTFVVAVDVFYLYEPELGFERIPGKEELYQRSIRNTDCFYFYSTHDGIDFSKQSCSIQLLNGSIRVRGRLIYDDNHLMQALLNPIIPWLENHGTDLSQWDMNVLNLKESNGKYTYDYDYPGDLVVDGCLRYESNQFVFRDIENIKDIEIEVKVSDEVMESFHETSKIMMPKCFQRGMDDFAQWYFRNDMEKCSFWTIVDGCNPSSAPYVFDHPE